jgi:peroxiredoxin (alkyl hydroperoxide reductase subunit C)
MPIQVGFRVPEWRGQAYVAGQTKDISSADYRGKWLLLFFYPLDFTLVCPTELKSLAVHEADFWALSTSIVAVSTDSVHSHQAWFSRDLPEVKFPVIADMTKRMSRDFGVLLEEKGTALRASLIIDPDGFLRYMVVSDQNVGRSILDLLRVIEALQTNARCPADWKRGVPFV